MSAQKMQDTDTPSHRDVVINDHTVNLARNALLVAGLEMGKEGDHWPVIKANIHALMHDYENLKIELAVQEQLREHLGQKVKEFEALLAQSDDAFRTAMAPHVNKMREIYDAMFTPVATGSEDLLMTDADEAEGRYASWKSSAAIIRSLKEEDNGR